MVIVEQWRQTRAEDTSERTILDSSVQDRFREAHAGVQGEDR